MSEIKVWSGNCCMCDVGIPVEGVVDMGGRDVHTGDIVLVWHGDGLGTDDEQWSPCPHPHLSVVVAEQYQSYSDGTIVRTGEWEPFTMGIRSAGVKGGEWDIEVLKKWHDVVDGEHWSAFGFRYAKADIADEAA